MRNFILLRIAEQTRTRFMTNILSSSLRCSINSDLFRVETTKNAVEYEASEDRKEQKTN